MDHAHTHEHGTNAIAAPGADSLYSYFSQASFMPHGHCYLWKPGLVWAHVLSDTLIGLAYLSISITLYFLVRKIRLPFSSMVLSFGIFIGACGATHFMEIWNLWHADYWAGAGVKVLTAMASVATALWLIKLRPKIVAVADSLNLVASQKAELEGLNRSLEDQVRARTEELSVRERQLRTMVDSIPQHAWMAHPDGQVFWFNQRWYDYTGARPEAVEGWGWLSVHEPEQEERGRRAWAQAVATGEPIELEAQLRGADGAYRWFLTRVTPLKDDSGRVVRWFGTNTDIDDQKRNQGQLERALRIRDEFISLASHELKTPITSMKLQTQMMAKSLKKVGHASVDPRQLDRLLDISGQQLDRLNRLVDDMLDISRISAGRFAIERAEFELGGLLRDVAGRYTERMLSSDAQISVDVVTEITGRWDRFRLEQVVDNLVSNAIKYGEGRPILLRLRLAAPGLAEVSVTDQGIGIAKEYQGRVFERFERAVSTSHIAGLGLGLYIVRTIVQAHGGTIRMESEVGKGSAFFVQLPF